MLATAAPLPLIVLRQMLTISLRVGTLDLERLPSSQDTLRLGASLIVLNSSQHVGFARDSVAQFLLGQRSNGSSNILDDMKYWHLAGLCFQHLAS